MRQALASRVCIWGVWRPHFLVPESKVFLLLSSIKTWAFFDMYVGDLALFIHSGLSNLTRFFPPMFLTGSCNVDLATPMSLACERNDFSGLASIIFFILSALRIFFLLAFPGFLSTPLIMVYDILNRTSWHSQEPGNLSWWFANIQFFRPPCNSILASIRKLVFYWSLKVGKIIGYHVAAY